MKKKNVISANYLDKIPVYPAALTFTTDEEGIVTLAVENTGWANRLAQAVFRRPKVSYVHLDAFGSFVWLQCDGERSITRIGELVEEKYGSEAHPLYERLAVYFRRLESYGFISWK